MGALLFTLIGSGISILLLLLMTIHSAGKDFKIHVSLTRNEGPRLAGSFLNF